MKILDFNLTTKKITLSRQVALKNTFVQAFLNLLMRNEDVNFVYELDDLYTKDNLQTLSELALTHTELTNIIHDVANFSSNKEIKKASTPVSIRLQDVSNKLYKQAQLHNMKDVNSFLFLHFPYPKVDRIMMEYINEHKNTTLTYEEIVKSLKSKCSTIEIRKFLFLGCDLNSTSLFSEREPLPSSEQININANFYLKETKSIPLVLNAIMELSILGFHILYENGQLKQILFFNPYNDVLTFHYRRSTKGCTKVTFFVAVPVEEGGEVTDVKNKEQMRSFIKRHYAEL